MDKHRLKLDDYDLDFFFICLQEMQAKLHALEVPKKFAEKIILNEEKIGKRIKT